MNDVLTFLAIYIAGFMLGVVVIALLAKDANKE